jgi:hypothetical protein
MAIYGIGAVYDGKDMTDAFVQAGAAAIGWNDDDAPYAHQLFRRITVGDIIYIKSYPPKYGLHIKAVGMVTEPCDPDREADELGHRRISVDWRWYHGPAHTHAIGTMSDKADFMRRGSLYEELNPKLQKLITDLLLARTPLELIGSASNVE